MELSSQFRRTEYGEGRGETSEFSGKAGDAVAAKFECDPTIDGRSDAHPGAKNSTDDPDVTGIDVSSHHDRGATLVDPHGDLGPGASEIEVHRPLRRSTRLDDAAHPVHPKRAHPGFGVCDQVPVRTLRRHAQRLDDPSADGSLPVFVTHSDLLGFDDRLLDRVKKRWRRNCGHASSPPCRIDNHGGRRGLRDILERGRKRAYKFAKRGTDGRRRRRRSGDKEEGPSLRRGEAAEIGRSAAGQPPASVATLLRVDRDARYAKRLEVAASSSFRHLEFLGHLGCGHQPATLKQQEYRHKAVGTHVTSIPGKQDIRCPVQVVIVVSMTTSTILAPTDPRSFFATAVALGGATITAVSPGQLTQPTPCDSFDVRTLIGHLVAVLQRVANVGNGGTVHDTPEIVEGVTDDGWPTAWNNAAHDVQRVWSDDAKLGTTFTLPWAQLPGTGLLAMYTNEVTVHTWDLAKATGQQPEWSDPVIAFAWEAMQHALPATGRTEEFEAVRAAMPEEFRDWDAPFAEAVPVDDHASPIDRLVAWSGRRP